MIKAKIEVLLNHRQTGTPEKEEVIHENNVEQAADGVEQL